FGKAIEKKKVFIEKNGGLVDFPRVVARFQTRPTAFVEFRSMVLDPPIDCRVIDMQSVLFVEIIGSPPHLVQDEFRKMSTQTTEPRQLFLASHQPHAFAVPSTKCASSFDSVPP